MTSLMKLKNWAFAAVFTTCLTTGVAFAHHGWSGYDDSKELNLTGVIQESSYGNPHGTMKLKVAGENSKTWTTILAPPSRMDARGLSAKMLEKGTTATVVGYPHKEHDNEMRAESITVGGKTVKLRK